VREIISICVEEKKAGIKSEEAYISRMRGATPSRWIQTKLFKCVRFTDIIKHAQFNRCNLGGFGAMRC